MWIPPLLPLCLDVSTVGFRDLTTLMLDPISLLLVGPIVLIQISTAFTNFAPLVLPLLSYLPGGIDGALAEDSRAQEFVLSIVELARVGILWSISLAVLYFAKLPAELLELTPVGIPP